MKNELFDSSGARNKISGYWPNPHLWSSSDAFAASPSSREIVGEAEKDWDYFSALLRSIFEELAGGAGRIASPLLRAQGADFAPATGQDVLIKADHLLPVTGTVKARGGFFEVLQFARTAAIAAGLVGEHDPSQALHSDSVRQHFSKITLVTGSTGNLGYAIGVIGRALGFRVEVHMSSDVKGWKVERLENIGVAVQLHDGDFSCAVSEARSMSQMAPDSYFIDDENSGLLFQGYSSAAIELQAQLQNEGVVVDEQTPLVVYLPCGIGGSPGGVTFGLKSLYGDAVHCIFAEPTSSPSMLLQVTSGLKQPLTVYEYGLDNKTAADGLAVPTASMLVVEHVAHLVDGFVTVTDEALRENASRLWEAHGLRLELSAAAGFAAMEVVANAPNRPDYFERATHLVWTTGGSQLPDNEVVRK